MNAIEIFEQGRKAENASLDALQNALGAAAQANSNAGILRKIANGAGNIVRSGMGGIGIMVIHMAVMTILDQVMQHLIGKAAPPGEQPRQLTDNEINSLVADYVKRLPEDQKKIVLGNKSKVIGEIKTGARAAMARHHSARKHEAKDPTPEELEALMSTLKSHLVAHPGDLDAKNALQTTEKALKKARFQAASPPLRNVAQTVDALKPNHVVVPVTKSEDLVNLLSKAPKLPSQPKKKNVPGGWKGALHGIDELPKKKLKNVAPDDAAAQAVAGAMGSPLGKKWATSHRVGPWLDPNKPAGMGIGLNKKTLAIGSAITITGAMLIYAAHRFISWLKDRGEKPSKMSDEELKHYIDENLEDYHLPSVVVRARTDDKFRKKLVEDTLKAVRESDKLGDKSLVLASKGILKHPDDRGQYSPVEHKGILGRAADTVKSGLGGVGSTFGNWGKQNAKSALQDVGEFSRRAVVGFGKAAVAVGVAYAADQVSKKMFSGEGKLAKLGQQFLSTGAAMTSLGGLGMSLRSNDPLIRLELEKYFLQYMEDLEKSGNHEKIQQAAAMKTIWVNAATNSQIREQLFDHLAEKIEQHKAGAAGSLDKKHWTKRS